jgi:hypothetical protein
MVPYCSGSLVFFRKKAGQPVKPCLRAIPALPDPAVILAKARVPGRKLYSNIK